MFEELFSRRGLSLDRLKTLVEVDIAGSIARAGGDNLNKQSQYSRQLREISEFFGCEMAERRGRTIQLTQEGRQLASFARHFFQRLNDYALACRGDRIKVEIGGGDSLIQWLVIPRIAKIVDSIREVRLGTLSLTTQEVVEKVSDCRLDFGMIRKNALIPGIQSADLGPLTYCVAVPRSLLAGRAIPTIADVFKHLPMAMQISSGEFTSTLQIIASEYAPNFRPALACQSLPQVLAAVKSRRFAAVLPELAISELPDNTYQLLTGCELLRLNRDICLIWNPRVLSVRPFAIKVLEELKATLRIKAGF